MDSIIKPTEELKIEFRDQTTKFNFIKTCDRETHSKFFLDFILQNYHKYLIPLQTEHLFFKLYIKMLPLINITLYDNLSNLLSNVPGYTTSAIINNGCTHYDLWENNVIRHVYVVKITETSYYMCSFKSRIKIGFWRKWFFMIFHRSKYIQHQNIIDSQIEYIGSDECIDRVSKAFDFILKKSYDNCQIYDLTSTKLKIYLSGMYLDDSDRINDSIHFVLMFSLYQMILNTNNF